MQYIIATGFRADKTLLDNHAANLVLKEIACLSLKLDHETDCIGSYKEEGQDKPSQEISHIYSGNSERVRKLAILATTQLQQDAVLILDGDYMSEPTAYLVTFDGSYLHYECLGRFAHVTEEEAKAAVAYTWINGDYYVCVK